MEKFNAFAGNSGWHLLLSSNNQGEFMNHQGLQLVTLSPKVLNHRKWTCICHGSVPVGRIPLDAVVRGPERTVLPSSPGKSHFLHVRPWINSFLALSFGSFISKWHIKIISAQGWLGASFSLLWVCGGPELTGPPGYFKFKSVKKGEDVYPLTLLSL